MEEEGGGGGSAAAALEQCELLQNMIEISLASLEGLRTKCATSNDLTQKEMRTLEGKLVKYFSRQLCCKQSISSAERDPRLEEFPSLHHWLRIVGLHGHVMQELLSEGDLSLECLLPMTEEEVRETVKTCGGSMEECARLIAALTCLRNAHQCGGSDSKQEWVISWPTKESPTTSGSSPEGSQRSSRGELPPLPASDSGIHDDCGQVDALASLPSSPSLMRGRRLPTPTPPETPPLSDTMATPPSSSTPATPATPPPPLGVKNKRSKVRNMRPPGTPPPPVSRKLVHLLPGFQTLHRSKSHESQLANRIEDVANMRGSKKARPFLNPAIQGGAGSCDNLPVHPRVPINPAERLARQACGCAPYTPTTPPISDDPPQNTLTVPRWSPQNARRDFGNSIKHRFSTKYWMSQTCMVCAKGMLFGVKCKNCKLKCHNKCTKEAPPCRLLFIRPGLKRTESVPCDMNNRRPHRMVDLHQSKTLPREKQDQISVPYQPDSSSNPSSTTSSTPSSPAPHLISNPPSATPPSPCLHPSPQAVRHAKPHFNFAAHCFQHKQQFVFPDVSPEIHKKTPQVILHPVNSDNESNENQILPPLPGNLPILEIEASPDPEPLSDEEDDLEDLPDALSLRNLPRKQSQTTIFLQEWDIPYEQLAVDELIGRGRFGKVYRGRWHGQVAIRLIEMERDNEAFVKLFKREVMGYRQTRHENVVLFMGACMNPPHLAIVTSLCKGRTLYSYVRDSKTNLDINKIRQIAQEIAKGLGYLHAKGIIHKDLKSKNIFYDNGKVVITDFGLFSISGVMQDGRRDSELKIPHGWLCYLSPEIIRVLSPAIDADKLPFSKPADVYAFGTIWYELQARDWPFHGQPAEAIIWQVGNGLKPDPTPVSMVKEILDIILACWSNDPEERPTFTQLMEMIEKLPKLNRRRSHPCHFWKSAEL
ncbi:kinase suppressor of Ras 2 isoform X3 [Petromyzon marinus]|uniref:kinase suppressor of Ras 2 isoform X3 n=1 Tax=Petromyzon marinus TaxID=7757 RepID=UPI003F6F32E9